MIFTTSLASGLAPSPDRCWLRMWVLVPIDAVLALRQVYGRSCCVSRENRGVTVRIAIRVRPGASRTRVGGSRGGALVVAVTAPAVDGRATEAALAAIASALGVRRRAVRLVSGATSRDKIVEVDTPDPGPVAERVAALRSPPRPAAALQLMITEDLGRQAHRDFRDHAAITAGPD